MLPSTAMGIEWVDATMNAAPVNCEPWSVLTTSGLPWRAMASSSASTQKAASRVIDKRHDSTLAAEPIEYEGEIDKAARHRNARDVYGPVQIPTKPPRQTDMMALRIPG